MLLLQLFSAVKCAFIRVGLLTTLLIVLLLENATFLVHQHSFHRASGSAFGSLSAGFFPQEPVEKTAAKWVSIFKFHSSGGEKHDSHNLPPSLLALWGAAVAFFLNIIWKTYFLCIIHCNDIFHWSYETSSTKTWQQVFTSSAVRMFWPVCTRSVYELVFCKSESVFCDFRDFILKVKKILKFPMQHMTPVRIGVTVVQQMCK